MKSYIKRLRENLLYEIDEVIGESPEEQKIELFPIKRTGDFDNLRSVINRNMDKFIVFNNFNKGLLYSDNTEFRILNTRKALEEFRERVKRL